AGVLRTSSAPHCEQALRVLATLRDPKQPAEELPLLDVLCDAPADFFLRRDRGERVVNGLLERRFCWHEKNPVKPRSLGTSVTGLTDRIRDRRELNLSPTRRLRAHDVHAPPGGGNLNAPNRAGELRVPIQLGSYPLQRFIDCLVSRNAVLPGVRNF